jgi:sulfide:quinone oxidoreductase
MGGCRVPGAADVWAAGDATTFPLKQGGLATQQADAVAEALAAELGATVRPQPFRPVLRGLLLTGGAPLYLRSRLSLTGEPVAAATRFTSRRLRAAVSGRALWWPPGKIAGRYLAPLLAGEDAAAVNSAASGASTPRGTAITGQCAARTTSPLTPPTSTERSGP